MTAYNVGSVCYLSQSLNGFSSVDVTACIVSINCWQLIIPLRNSFFSRGHFKMASSPPLKRFLVSSGYSSTMAIAIIIVTAAVISVSSAAEPEVSQHRNVEDQVSSGLIPVFRMVNWFLNDVIQSVYLTELAKKVPMTTYDAFIDALSTQWNEVLIYGIGFVVCFAIGLASVIGFLLAALIFPCCRCCGRCGSKVPEEMDSAEGCCRRQSGRKSRCCTWTMQIFLALASVGLILGNIPMYVVNEQFYPQLKNDFFVDFNNSIIGLESFIKKIPREINQTVVVEFDVLENSVMSKLYRIPDDVLIAIDNETGVVTSLNELHAFTSNMTELSTTMATTSQTAVELQLRTDGLYSNFTNINGSISSKCNIPSECSILLTLLSSVHVAVNFTPVAQSLSAGQLAVNASLEMGLVEMVAFSVKQLDDVSDSVNQSISGSVADVQKNFDDVSIELNNIVKELIDSLSGLDLDDARNTVMGGQEYTQLAADITYGVCLGLSIILSLIIAFNVLGLVFGILFPPCKSQSRKRCKCRRDKSVGSKLLMASVVLTFVFYWFYMLMTAVLFVVGGAAQTEACRHLLYYENTRSKAVLGIFDSWANVTLSDKVGFPVLPFDTYSECAKNATIYKAMNLDTKWNITELTETDEIDEALEQMKGVAINVPQVNLTNSKLNDTLMTLDKALGPETLNFTLMYSAVDGTVFDPDLAVVITAMENVKNPAVDLTADIAAMNALLNASRQIERDRDQLVKNIQYIEHYVGQAHFAKDAATLSSGQDTINANGSQIVGLYVNNTADSIYNDVSAYSTHTVYSVENTVANCRPVYDDATTLIDSFCVESIYLINGWWYSLGWCLAFLVPSLVLAIHLETVYRYTATTNSVSHLDDAPISAYSAGPLMPGTPPPTYEAANDKGVIILATIEPQQPEQSQSKPVPPPTKPKPKLTSTKSDNIPEPDY